ncbi:MAG: hypothetical protein MJA83_15985 [Gammaproteobacteria bacterium]|nr:hypothetical protein [Gammaproteobacteria bacterium]
MQPVIGMVDFRMTIGAEKLTLLEFSAESCNTAVGHCSKIQFKRLACRINMVPNQGREIPVIATNFAAPSPFRHQFTLAAQAARLLAKVALVPVVSIGIFAFARTEFCLATIKGE